MRVIVLKKNRSNKRATTSTKITTATTTTAAATTTATARELPSRKSLSKKELFVSKLELSSPRAEGIYSTTAAAPSMKKKWLKAIKSLKPASGTAVPTDRRNGAAGASSSQSLLPIEEGSHHLQEYTYKKITACDVCSQILRGHTRQGLRCRICKLNAHGDCAAQLPGCQPKQKLLRRQKSTPELENRIDLEEEKLTDIKQVYRALKEAGDLKNSNHHIAVDKSIQNVCKEGGPRQPTDIATIHVPDYPERSDRPATTGGSISGSGSGSTSQMLPTTTSRDVVGFSGGGGGSSGRGGIGGAVITRPGVRPPPVAMPILGVQLQQQELQRSGLGGGGLPTIASVVSAAALPVPSQDLSSSSALNSPRRQKLNLRIKSLSLDSSQPHELHGRIRKCQYLQQEQQLQQQQQQQHQNQKLTTTTTTTIPTPTMIAMDNNYYHYYDSSYYSNSCTGLESGGHLGYMPSSSNNSRLHSPSSPLRQGRKLLYASRRIRGVSTDLPDDIEKSQSSASTSPCPSPKSHRLLSSNLYVVLYNFKGRHADELDLKAGYKVTVIDTSDPDWWKGKAMGVVGYFPSKYVMRLNANEKPLQVTNNLQVSDGESGDSMTLLRDQIVIQAGDELNGMVLVRSADNREGYCPIKYLQEV